MLENYFVSTFNKRLYDSYGDRFLETFLKTEQSAHMFCYVEEDPNVYPSSEKITYLNIYEECPNLEKFVKRFKDRKSPPPDRKYTLKQDDALKFSFKVHAQYAARNYGKRMFYVDFDCVFMDKIPTEWYEKYLEGVDFAYYARPKYTETGFIAFTTENDLVQRFFEKYISVYVDDSLYNLENGYHDCIVFDETLKCFPERKERIYGDRSSHTMTKCRVLNPFIDHRKGDRKNYLNSPEWYLSRQGKMIRKRAK